MHKLTISILCFACFVCCQAPAPPGEPAIGGSFPADFGERAFEHIAQLARLGPRSPGARGEEQALQYIRRQFEKTGLEVRLERFDYETFKVGRFDFAACGEEIEPEMIGFNPYTGPFTFSGEPLFLAPEITGDELNELDLRNKLLITTSPVDYFRLILGSPRLIVYVSNSDFTALAQKDCSSSRLAVKGTFERHTSTNIIAELDSRTADDEEVIISAHWDSYRDSPGADDNGSGVAVLLELARFFSTFKGDIGGNIKFVSFGVEELGVVGSRAYLNMHHQDLKDCKLVFNIDQVGGPEEPVVEMLGGVRGIPELKVASQLPTRIRNRTLEGLDGRWRLSDPDVITAFMVTNRPAWLVEALEASVEQHGFGIRATGNLGSDQQVFAQAGVVATGIGAGGNQTHSPGDLPAQINRDNLEIVGKIVASVVLMSLRSLEAK